MAAGPETRVSDPGAGVACPRESARCTDALSCANAGAALSRRAMAIVWNRMALPSTPASAGREGPETGEGSAQAKKQRATREGKSNRAVLRDGVERLRPEQIDDHAPDAGNENFAHPIDGDVGGEGDEVDLRGENHSDEGKHSGHSGADGEADFPRSTGGGNQLGDRIAGRDVPGHERLNLAHHALGKAVGWSEVRKLFDQGRDRTSVIEPASTVVAFGDVRLERRRAESNLVVEELIDFVGQEMSVIHCASFTRWC